MMISFRWIAENRLSHRMQSLLFFFLLLFPALCVAQPPDSVYIGEIRVEGNRRTHEWVIIRELTIQPGVRLSRKELKAQLERSRQNLFNLTLFFTVQLTVEDSLNPAPLLVRVTERGLIGGSPYLDLQERNAYDLLGALRARNFRRLVFGGAVQLINFSGSNETLSVYGQLGFSQVLAIQLHRAAFSRRYNLDGRLAFRFTNEHEIIIGTEAGRVRWQSLESQPMQRTWEAVAEINKRLTLYRNASIQFRYQFYQFTDSLTDFEVGGAPLQLITQADGQEQYPSLLISLSEDRRDWRTFPLKGFKWKFLARLAGPKPIASTQFATLGAGWAHHLPLNRRWNFAYGMQQLITVGDSIPFFEKNFIGISRSNFPDMSYELRGYHPYAIGGTFVHMTKAEGKFALLPIRQVRLPFVPLRRFHDFPLGVYLTAFCDLGYVKDRSFNRQDAAFLDQWLIGYGPGVNVVVFFDTLFRVEYAWNHRGESGLYVNAVVPIK